MRRVLVLTALATLASAFDALGAGAECAPLVLTAR
jgi:hypothetical protein